MNMRISKLIGLCLLSSILAAAGLGRAMAETTASYSVIESEKQWPENLGHHRARVLVDAAVPAVRIHLPWRLQFGGMEKRAIIVTDPAGLEVTNALRVTCSREAADVVFEGGRPGEYAVYYLPYTPDRGCGGYGGDYLPYVEKAQPVWRQANALDAAAIQAGKWKTLPEAKLIGLQARSEFDRFDPMAVIATADEVTAFKAAHPQPLLLFPEDRKFPIRMLGDLPLRWTARGPTAGFTGEARPNEYYVFQIGAAAPHQAVANVSVEFSLLCGPGKAEIPVSAMTCFNLGGIDSRGLPFTKAVGIPAGKVQPLWCGIQVGMKQAAGVYTGTVTLRANGIAPQSVAVKLTVAGEALADCGDGDLWRLARLRWLNSTAGSEETVIAPYQPLGVQGETLTCLGRQVTLGGNGLPAAIQAGTERVLSAPMRFAAETPEGAVAFGPGTLRFTQRSDARVCWESEAKTAAATLTCKGEMEFDGHLRYFVTMTPAADMKLKDVLLEMSLRKEAAKYMIGAGLLGGARPAQHEWRWNGPYDSFWLGGVHAGLWCELRGGSYHGPLLNLYHPAPPATWHNGGKGGVTIADAGADQVVARAFSGPRELKVGEKLTFEFALLITPVKPLDSAQHFRERYYHSVDDIPPGINLINVHHATPVNPYINYPFLAVDKMREFCRTWQARGAKVKIYYTVRELTSRVTELWALRSLGDEVLAGGGEGGFPWLREHLVNNYTPQWYTQIQGGGVDAAILTSGASRWYNYYVEGLGWLVKNIPIDGLYLDDVTYDRTILKRMRKVMERNRPGCMIDLHSNTGFSIGPADQYLEFMPYVDRTWFGESFNYDAMTPDQWLVEVSGIPFGLMGDMLQNGGNRWRGMVYGMTARLPCTDAADPRPVWKAWDDFGIAESKMIGWWEENCPVRTDHPEVLATVYVRQGRTLVALASWAAKPVTVNLKIDWPALGLKPGQVILKAPAVDRFQPEHEFKIGEPIPVEPLQGWMLIIEGNEKEST